MISTQEARALIRMSDREQTAIDLLEASVDRAIAQAQMSDKLAGAPVVATFLDNVPPKLVHALARRYEESGGWMAEVETSNAQCALALWHPPMSQFVIKDTPAPLPMITQRVPTLMEQSPLRVLVRMPTRSRPRQALSVLEQYQLMAGIAIDLEVVIDSDDPTMMDPLVLQRLHALGAVVTVGEHKSKVAACNAGRVTGWDILILASDDMVPAINGYGERIVKGFREHFPHHDGALHFDDGYAHESVCTIPILGRRLYDQLGYIYHPAYESLYCDNEYTKILQSLGRIVYLPESVIEHRHFVTGKAECDALYERNEALGGRDQRVYNDRKAIDFGLESTILSICIASIPERRASLDRLVDHLYRQIDEFEAEVVIDDGEGSIGAKRQRLLERTRGRYVCFVDDDDYVAHNFIGRILEAIGSYPGSAPDCVSLRGIMTVNGERSEPFEHSLKYTEWQRRDGLHERNPNHLNPVRRELALQAGFPGKERGEDRAYSSRLRPLLKSEADTGPEPLYFYFYQEKK